jgi:hypothetical protein
VINQYLSMQDLIPEEAGRGKRKRNQVPDQEKNPVDEDKAPKLTGLLSEHTCFNSMSFLLDPLFPTFLGKRRRNQVPDQEQEKNPVDEDKAPKLAGLLSEHTCF